MRRIFPGDDAGHAVAHAVAQAVHVVDDGRRSLRVRLGHDQPPTLANRRDGEKMGASQQFALRRGIDAARNGDRIVEPAFPHALEDAAAVRSGMIPRENKPQFGNLRFGDLEGVQDMKGSLHGAHRAQRENGRVLIFPHGGEVFDGGHGYAFADDVHALGSKSQTDQVLFRAPGDSHHPACAQRSEVQRFEDVSQEAERKGHLMKPDASGELVHEEHAFFRNVQAREERNGVDLVDHQIGRSTQVAPIVTVRVPVDAVAVPEPDDAVPVARFLGRAPRKPAHEKGHFMTVGREALRQGFVHRFRSARERMRTVLPGHPENSPAGG